MNTNEALKTLAELFANFQLHPLFMKEFASLLKKELHGKEGNFFKLLTAQLNNIKTFGVMVYTIDDNERIKGMDGRYYSIHLQQSQFNVRLLVHIDDNGLPRFLCAFYERSGKRQTDYSKYTPVLKQRFEEMRGDDNDE